jgi:Polyketide cyclase / dehydrase and lipid transport
VSDAASSRGASRPIIASRELAAPAGAVASFLSDLSNHAQLAPDSVEVIALTRRPSGAEHAVVRLRGPLGIRRTASTELAPPVEPNTLTGWARIGRRTLASVSWVIRGDGESARVALQATVESAARFDALALRLGGRRWLAGHFAAALDRLAAELAPATDRAAEHVPRDWATGSPVPLSAGRTP